MAKTGKKTGKTELVKARVSKPMKEAVAAAAGSKGGGEGEAEASVIREALAEYFTKRGVTIVEASATQPAPIPRRRRSSGSSRQAKKTTGKPLILRETIRRPEDS